MKPERTYIDYLEDMLDAFEKVAEFIQGLTLDEFTGDEKTAFAVIRGLEIIGEATKKIPQSVKDSHSEMPWREMAGIRDKLIHDYVGVNLVAVWKTASEDLPSLGRAIRRMLAEADA